MSELHSGLIESFSFDGVAERPVSRLLDNIKTSENNDFELILNSVVDGVDMARIPKSWRLGGDLNVDRGLFVEGKVSGKIVAPGHVVIMERGSEATQGVECELLICVGRVGGRVVASEIIIGEDGDIDALDIYVKRGKLMNLPGSSFSGTVHVM